MKEGAMRRVVAHLITGVVLVTFAAASVATPRKGTRPAERPPDADTARVQIGPPDGGTEAFVAHPPGTKPAPAVIVVHEWWGLNGQIRDVARRFARDGYVAIVPDLYHGKVATDAEKAHELVRGLDQERAIVDLEHAVAWLRAQPRTAKARIGVVGFCMGGSLAQALALTDTTIAVVAMFYGQPDTDPVRIARLRAPLQGHFGLADEGIPASKVEEFKSELERAGKTAEIYTYAGAGHAFMNDARPAYHADAARQAWARMMAFLQKHLKV
jgi:carboxymethylenebutenolidase